MKKSRLCAAIILGLLFAFNQPAGAAPWVYFDQRISELDCVITTIVREDGSLSYSLPLNCGKLVVPDLPGKQPLLYQKSFSQFGVPPEGEAAMLFLRTKPIYLETDPMRQPAGGYVILVSKDIKYSFRLMGEADLLHDRTFEVIRSDAKSVTVRFLPEGAEVTILRGETVKFQLAYDNTPDVYLTYIQQNSDGSLVMRVRFPSQKELLHQAEERHNSFVATSLLLTFGVIGIILILQNWFLKRKGVPQKQWWSTHEHNPI